MYMTMENNIRLKGLCEAVKATASNVKFEN